MEIIEVTGKPPYNKEPLTMVIGKFDGIHKGHEAILRTARQYMDKENDTLAVMTFSDNPLWVIKQDPNFKRKITRDIDKFDLLERFGFERFYRILFTKEYARTTAETFVLEHLSQLNVKRIIVGEGFRFGSGATSSTDALIGLCKQLKIDVIVVPSIKESGTKISSRHIRALIEDGLLEPAHSLLGRPFTITGKVVHGQKMGRKLGFPTINLGEIDEYVEPKPGVYLGVVGIHQNDVITEYYHVLISAGYRPTVKGEGYLVEAHLLNFSGDLYDKTVSVSFLRFMREEVNFNGLDALIEQMEQDKQDALQLIGQNE
ncbi:bifunctional riboflavin kinase/FAD synthetase [Aquibacillus kalidii]|uniref:bifunctional riboflavin kinase/FAD synthetase n=1 Tax=Aquibacillus kalidii TaxID=2762597 RepID=UPI001F0051A7|nr:bifunctional riboflavin kinase/FAD synthetase [Aquibacillus kalidii]